MWRFLSFVPSKEVKMKSKKIISIVMTSAMMTSMFPVASYAETQPMWEQL